MTSQVTIKEEPGERLGPTGEHRDPSSDHEIRQDKSAPANGAAYQDQDVGVPATATNSAAALAGATCMELALEGERLCKSGDLKNGVRFFEEAIKVGTNDNRTLSAIYSQLGNAYFYLEDYQKALEYHQLDVRLVHAIGDEAAEAKACGNLGNTYKMLGKFEDAIFNCRRYWEISKKLNDESGEGRALYNLGNVYHIQGKRMIGVREQEMGDLSKETRAALEEAVKYYEMNLKVVTKLKDHALMGRAYGNLGNTHYLLGNFEAAIESHKKRLELARQTNDKSAERRAQLNLGNANVFMSNFQEAIENYTATLKLAQELQDKYTEANACYNLANTHTFLRDYRSAIDYHLKYLEMIKEFDDKLGVGRACWSLVNLYQMVDDPESALTFALRHRAIAEQLGDKPGLTSAELNIAELEEILAQKQAASSVTHKQSESGSSYSSHHHHSSHLAYRLTPDKRQEQEQRRFKKQLNNLTADIDGLAARRKGRSGVNRSSSSEKLFDMIAHFQKGRLDDQRCEIANRPNLPQRKPLDSKENISTNADTASQAEDRSSNNRSSHPIIANPINAVSAAASAIKATYRKASLVAYPTTGMPSLLSQRRPTMSAENHEFFDLIAGAQRQRMDEQRASLPSVTLANGVVRNPRNGSNLNRGHTIDQSISSAPCTKPSRGQVETVPETIPELQAINSNSSKAPSVTDPKISSSRNPSSSNRPKLSKHFQTFDSSSQVQDEKFLESLERYQSNRYNDQRSEFPKKTNQGRAGCKKEDKNQPEDFLNLIAKFQSDRYDDQRSAPPTKSEEI